MAKNTVEDHFMNFGNVLKVKFKPGKKDGKPTGDETAFVSLTHWNC